MHIAYISLTRFPTEKAHGWQIAQVCRAMAKLGHKVTVVSPGVRNNTDLSPSAYYGIEESFCHKELVHFDPWEATWVPGILKMVVTARVFGKALRKYVKEDLPELLYVRSPLLLRSLLSSGIPVILELHTLPIKFKRRFVRHCNACTRVVCLTTLMRTELIRMGVRADHVMVEGDGVDFAAFQNLPSAEEARNKWQLPQDRQIIGYIGSLVTQDALEKGVSELLRALAELSTRHPVFGWIVGGPEPWRKAYEELAYSMGLTDEHVRFQERVTASDVPVCMAALDICVYPAPATDHAFFRRDTSPLKLFEYLASGKPVVCADILPVHDVVDESQVVFCEPGDSVSLVAALEETLLDPSSSAARAAAGKEKALWYDWEARMSRILSGI